MRKITCYDCGKNYDYDTDDFCPRCGAYTPPARQRHINAHGDVVRVEGINETNHAGSFVHAELHKENRQRTGSLLESEPEKKAVFTKPSVRETARRVTSLPQNRGRATQKKRADLSIWWSIIAIMILSILSKIS